MAVEPAPTTWVSLVQAVTRGGTAEEVLGEALPLLRTLSAADTVLVVRRRDETWTSQLSEGEELPVEQLVPLLGRADEGRLDAPVEVPRSAVVAWRRVPAQPLSLVLAWRDRPAPGAEAALDLVLLALARADAEERYDDLVARVDNAQMLANMGDYDWHIETDTNRWSDQLYRIYGHEPQSFNASYERFLSFIHPEDQDWIKQLHQHAYATGEPYAMTERIVRPDGEVRYLSSNGQVIMSPEGRPVRMRGTCIDITDRVRAEEERQRNAARFANLVESSPDAILVMDGDGEVVQANGRAHHLLGGDPVGHHFAALLPTDAVGEEGAVEGAGVDGRPLLLDVTMADLGRVEGEGNEVAAFLHDARPRLRSEALAAAVREGQVRRRQAMEINDNVVQGLSAAVYALRDGRDDMAGTVLDRTLQAARRMMTDLLEPVDGDDIGPGDLVRSSPSHLGGAPA